MKKRKYYEMFGKNFNLLFAGFYILIFIFFNLKIIQLGYRIEKLRNEYEDLVLLNKTYNLKITELLNPENLEKERKEKNIYLENPKNWCFLEIKGANDEVFPETSIVEGQTR
ncbi:MAG: hypothetical protein NC926_01205 [Candidatus Omnitrophica bacterium]|nr:hypothetical protein [Candidatus Omnitrophota bacterium]MCM8806567.1 hypothetical protein [Candidatus Omnitrophota bacterium]